MQTACGSQIQQHAQNKITFTPKPLTLFARYRFLSQYFQKRREAPEVSARPRGGSAHFRGAFFGRLYMFLGTLVVGTEDPEEFRTDRSFSTNRPRLNCLARTALPPCQRCRRYASGRQSL